MQEKKPIFVHRKSGDPLRLFEGRRARQGSWSLSSQQTGTGFVTV
jgi:hypothetical protein